MLTLIVAGVPADQPKDGKAGPKSADETLYQTLREVINRGADLYNGGDPAACYRLFEGALMAIKPTLDRHPELQQAIGKGLASADKDPVMWRRAFTLRSVLDKVRAEVNPNRSKEKDKEKAKDKDKDKLPLPTIDTKKEEKKVEKKEDKKDDKKDEKKDDNKDDKKDD
jgi:hypothetical protein